MTSLEHVSLRVQGIRTSACRTKHASQKNVIDLSSGDSQQAGMKPLSFLRQVLAGCVHPPLLDDQTLPVDVRQRAQTLLDACEQRSVDLTCDLTSPACLHGGSYTDSSGMDYVRQSIADFITRRDGVPCLASHVFIAGGSQRALMVMVKLLAATEWDVPTGVLTPVPSPLALPMLLDEAGVSLEPYDLNKDQRWAVSVDELHRALTAARGRGKPRAIFISNPGDPTGHVQSRKSIQEVIRFAAAEGLLLLVDEVYQDYVFGDGVEFISYKKILFEMGPLYSDTVEMASFHSISSLGECGLRAGYMELVNIDPRVMHFVDTMLCTDISTSVMGQLALDVMVKPPKPGDSSYETYAEERMHVEKTLKENCWSACKELNNVPGVSCEPLMGGIYLYPGVNVPPATIKQAKERQVEAGALHCDQLLQQQAVLIGPSCPHGPPPATHHFRLCILVPSDILEEALRRIQKFHQDLLESNLPSAI